MNKTQQLTRLALFSALAYVVMLVGRVPVFEFLSYDPKDVILTITGFAFGPLAAAVVTFVVSLIELLLTSTTGIIGFIMNVISSCGFACVAAAIYKKTNSLKGAIVGLAAGCLVMTALMLLWNYIITPFYLGIPRESVADMLLPIFLPFNILKSTINSGFVLLLYKPVRRVLGGIGIIGIKDTTTGTKGLAQGAMIAFFLIGILITVMVFWNM